MRRIALLAACLVVLAPASGQAAKPKQSRSWAQAEIKLVVGRGMMAPSVAAFRPDAPLTQAALSELIAQLTDSEPQAVSAPTARVTMAQLDAQLVRAVGLGDEAASFHQSAAAAGTRPPTRFGTEVVARLIGLRKNHPAGQDDLERLPSDVATRAEAAYSAAQILRLSNWELHAVEDAAGVFALPELTAWQRKILTTAFGLIGYPYVWGGESESRLSPFGPQPAGGFDCSGFAWRVYKLQKYPGAGRLADTLRGRTAAAMAGEVGPARRIRRARIAPADLLFFANGGPQAKPAAVDHMGIYIGNGWLVHSSRYGVALAPLEHWYDERLAWGRRPLLEAGLG
ncbi:MAG TPA: NlpC/P60 family protein [Gemmatimonadaceae bacterium]|nr:NlpC/P60 family protein [Gemmatimonadaceae bacterium]